MVTFVFDFETSREEKTDFRNQLPGRPFLQRVVSNKPQNSQQPGHIRGFNLNVISTDKLGEVVIHGMSGAVLV